MELAVVMDSAGVVTEWTTLAERLFGYSAGQAVGCSLGELIVPPALRPYHEMGFRRYVETREPHCVGYAVEVEALHEEGRTVPVEMKIVPRESGKDVFFEAHFLELG